MEIVEYEGNDYIMKPVMIFQKFEDYSNFYVITNYKGNVKIIKKDENL